MTEVWRLLSIQRHKLRFAKLAPVLLFFIFVTLKPVGGIVTGNSNSVLRILKRDSSPDIDFFEGDGNNGLIHILQRHSSDEYLTHEKGDLFPSGTSHLDILNAAKEVYAKGTRASQNPNRTMQIFEKRLKINGVSANWRLVIDTQSNRVITFFMINQN